MDILFILQDLWRVRNLQQWVNRRYNNPDKIILDKHDLKTVQTQCGALFAVNPAVNNALHIYREYDLSGIRPTDTILDIGACVGGFSIPAALAAPEGHIYAVEPLYVGELRENIVLNGLQDRITVIEAGLGSGEPLHIEYSGREKTIPTLPLSELRRMCGPVDFLKCDCEGAEWAIIPEDLRGIRRIEMETHQGRESVLPQNPALLSYLREHYTVRINTKRWPDIGSYWHCSGGSA